MIDVRVFEKLKKKYGDVSSWAIWALPEAGHPKSNVDDIRCFEHPELICRELKNQYVFIGLNASVHEGEVEPFRSFHSSDMKRQNDYVLRYALLDTEYWGSYITDLFKGLPITKSEELQKLMKSEQGPELMKANLAKLRDELSILAEYGCEKGHPVLVAMGQQVFEYLSKSELARDYEIKQIRHYSYVPRNTQDGRCEDYKNTVLKALSNK